MPSGLSTLLTSTKVDVERVQGAAKLGHPVTAKGARVVDPEDPMLVAVERDRLAPGLQIGAGRMEIGVLACI